MLMLLLIVSLVLFYFRIVLSFDLIINYDLVYQRGGSIIARKMRIRRSSTQMELDPVSLFVALDGQSKAQGDLYIDDGKTFDYKNGKFVYLRIAYTPNENGASITSLPGTYGTNTCAIVSPQQGYEVENTVERIVVMGHKSNPSSVTLYTSPQDTIGRKLSFEIDETKQGSTFIIKKPHVIVSHNWRIDVHF